MSSMLPVMLILTLALSGCSIEEGGGPYRPIDYESASQGKASLQEFKKKYVKVEDIEVAGGGVAAYGRRVRANIQARFPDGTIMYEGSYSYEMGFFNMAFKATPLASIEHGIWLGLNGMGIGGKRRITLESNSPENSNSKQVIVEATLSEGAPEIRTV